MTNEKEKCFAEWTKAKRNLAVAKRDVIAAKLVVSDAKIALDEAVEREIKR